MDQGEPATATLHAEVDFLISVLVCFLVVKAQLQVRHGWKIHWLCMAVLFLSTISVLHSCRYSQYPHTRHPYEANVKALLSGMDYSALRAILTCPQPSCTQPGCLDSLRYSWVNNRSQVQKMAEDLARSSVRCSDWPAWTLLAWPLWCSRCTEAHNAATIHMWRITELSNLPCLPHTPGSCHKLGHTTDPFWQCTMHTALTFPNPWQTYTWLIRLRRLERSTQSMPVKS